MSNIEIEHDGTCPTCKAGMYIEDDALKCVHCALVEAEEKIAKLEADITKLRGIIKMLGL